MKLYLVTLSLVPFLSAFTLLFIQRYHLSLTETRNQNEGVPAFVLFYFFAWLGLFLFNRFTARAAESEPNPHYFGGAIFGSGGSGPDTHVNIYIEKK
jgi:hypothetical protein